MNSVPRLIVTAHVALSLTAAATCTQAQSGTLEKVKKTNTIALGYRDSSVPFSFLDAQQKPVGISMDLCQSIIDRMKKDLKLPDLKVDHVPVTSSSRIPLITNGTVDIECGGTANNPERQKVVAFSIATFASQPRWLVKSDSGQKAVADLKGKTVVATQGSNAVGFAIRINDQQKLGMNIVQGKDHAESMLLLETGRASAFLEDDILLAGVRANSRNPAGYAFLPEGYETIYYGLMLRKDDPVFKALVDDTLAGLMKSGEFTRLYKKWFESPIPPRGVNLEFPMTDLLKERIRAPSDRPS